MILQKVVDSFYTGKLTLADDVEEILLLAKALQVPCHLHLLHCVSHERYTRISTPALVHLPGVPSQYAPLFCSMPTISK